MTSSSRKLQGEQGRNVTDPSPGTQDDKVARVQAFLHGVALVLTHHSAPFEVIQSLLIQAESYLMVDEEEKFLKRAKYMILWPMAVYLGNDPPPQADQPFHFRGRFWRWARQRINCYSRKNTHLWYSFLQSKRAALPVTPGVVLSNFQKHRDQMQAADPLKEGCEEDEELLTEVLENLEPVLRKLRKILSIELLEFFEHPEREVHKSSESASLESSRKTGGQAGHIRGLLDVHGLREPEQLFGLSEIPGPSKGPRGVAFFQLERSSARYGELGDLREILHAEIAKTDPNVVPTYSAKVEAVLEPFKVRTISKGESIPYYLAKRVQLVLHGAMRKMEPFRLIGRPFDAPDLLDLVRESNKYLDTTTNKWLSIDYSAATDGLSALLSKNIMKELLGPLFYVNPKLFNMMLGVLAPHTVHYPKVAGVQLEPVLQRNGQLMGSVLSFPVLCLANLGLYLTVRRRTHEWAPMSSMLKSVLVNGDDMLYIGSELEWETHKSLGRRIGLEMSPGKAYIHPRYANINSTSIDHDLASARSTPFEIKFLNVGLMVGRHKVLGKVGSDDLDKEHPISSVIDAVVSGSLPGKQAEVFKRYCGMHSVELRRETRGSNLFISKKLGGMGVSPIPGVDTTYTSQQFLLALYLIKRDPFLTPIPGPMQAGWFVRELMERHEDPIRLAIAAEMERRMPGIQPAAVAQWINCQRWEDYIFQHKVVLR